MNTHRDEVMNEFSTRHASTAPQTGKEKTTEAVHVPRALTIAGSDSGGGAGIQADLKTMHQHQVYGMSVLTAVTAQNTLGVQGVQEVSPEFVRLQLQSVFDDLRPDAVKTGMLASAPIIETVSKFLCDSPVRSLVVDPVMVAKGGHPLIVDEAILTVKQRLLPLADVVTPNIPEAQVLCGQALETWDSFHEAALALERMGARTVVIKGGHMPSSVQMATGNSVQNLSVDYGQNLSVDIVRSAGTWTYFCSPRIESKKTHGTGCTFASAIASRLASGSSILKAIAGAKAFVYTAILEGQPWDVGGGHGPTNHFVQPSAKFASGDFHFGKVYVYGESGWTVKDAPLV